MSAKPLDLAAARAACDAALAEDLKYKEANYAHNALVLMPRATARDLADMGIAALSEIETLRAHLTNVLDIGDILIEAADRDGDMSDEEVSGYRGRAAEVFAQLPPSFTPPR